MQHRKLNLVQTEPMEDRKAMDPTPPRLEHWKELIGAALVGTGVFLRMFAKWMLERAQAREDNERERERVREENERQRLAEALAKAEAAQADVRVILQAGISDLRTKIGALENHIRVLLEERVAFIEERGTLTERVRALEKESERISAGCEGCPLRRA